MSDTVLWCGFGVLVAAMLAIDLGFFNRKAHEIKIKEALLWSAFWIILALLFNLVIYYYKDHVSAVEYFTAYFLEKSLSMDNLFVFLMIFTFFKVPLKYQHRVLYWGILGALLMRFIFIYAGVSLIIRFDWILYVFGVLLIYSAYKMIKEKDKEIHPEKNPVIIAFRKFMPVTKDYIGGKFFTRMGKKTYATPLFIVLLVIETSDILFAIDSIPAVLAISQDTFIVYTSNIMAILGLRALFFAISAVMVYFRYLNYGLAIVLTFIGLKMLVIKYVQLPAYLSLIIIFGILIISILFSVYSKKKEETDDL